MKGYGLLKQIWSAYPFKKGCLPQILLGPFLNTMPIYEINYENGCPVLVKMLVLCERFYWNIRLSMAAGDGFIGSLSRGMKYTHYSKLTAFQSFIQVSSLNLSTSMLSLVLFKKAALNSEVWNYVSVSDTPPMFFSNSNNYDNSH